jgi:hypothetical protein
MSEYEHEQKRREKVHNLANEFLLKEALVNQYSIWLESSEGGTRHKGEDIYHMMVGALQAIEGGVDFIPGTGWQNLVEVISEVQERSGLNLGVCQFLKYNQNGLSDCGATENLSIGSLSMCIPPSRVGCKYRLAKLEKMSSEKKD